MKRLFKSTCWLTFLLTLFVGVYSECKFVNTKMPSKDLKAYQKLKPLLGHRYDLLVNSFDYDEYFDVKIIDCISRSRNKIQ